MRFLKAFLISSIMSVASLFVGAVGLAILNIYLSGHGIDWPNQELESGPVGMSPLSYLLGAFVFTVFLITFIVCMRILKKPNE